MLLFISWLHSPSAVILEPQKIKSRSLVHCKMIELRSSQMEDMHRTWKEGRRLPRAFQARCSSSALMCSPGSSLNPVLPVFWWRLYYIGMIH